MESIGLCFCGSYNKDIEMLIINISPMYFFV